MLPRFPPKLSLANLPTEFRPLDRVSEQLGGPRIWLKSDDCTGSLVSGNKIRKLEFFMADALARGCDTLLTCGGLQSNHCRATAAIAARLGLRCHLLLRGPPSLAESEDAYAVENVAGDGFEGNLLLDVLCGAEISVFSRQYYFDSLEREFGRLSDNYLEQGHRCYSIPTGGSNSLGLWGYINAAQELEADFARFNIDPRMVVCPTGSGGTQGGLTLGFHLVNPARNVLGIAVCDSSVYFEDKIRQDMTAWQSKFAEDTIDIVRSIAIHTADKYIGPGYAIGYPKLFECIRWLAEIEGVVLDPVYTGKAFYGLIEEMKQGKFDGFSDIVFVHTGGIYGLFPFKHNFHS